MINSIKEGTLDYIARYFGDLSKAVITVGLASHFFKEMPVFLRIGLIIVAFTLFVLSAILIERKGERK